VLQRWGHCDQWSIFDFAEKFFNAKKQDHGSVAQKVKVFLLSCKKTKKV
jgi:hypothetical protein